MGLRLNNFFLYRNYRVAAGNNGDEIRNLMDAVLSGDNVIIECYRDNKNSYTAKTTFDDQELIIKIPRGKNRKKSVRFFSLLRDSEPLRRYKDMAILRELGLNGPLPVLAAEKRSFGRVVHSFLIYSFVKGRMPEAGDEKKVIRELRKLHRLGYTRKDSKPENFLIAGEQVYFIDFKLKRPVIFRDMRVNLELAWFVRRMPDAIDYIDRAEQASLAFRFAVCWDKILLRIRTWRRKTRNRLLKILGQ